MGKLLPLQRSLVHSSHGDGRGSVMVYPTKMPSKRLAALMLVVYPGSLSLDETIADLATRAYASILTSCGDCSLVRRTSWTAPALARHEHASQPC